MSIAASMNDLRRLWGRGEQGSPNDSPGVVFDFRPNEGEKDVSEPASPHAPHGWQKNGCRKNGIKQPQRLQLRRMGWFCFG